MAKVLYPERHLCAAKNCGSVETGVQLSVKKNIFINEKGFFISKNLILGLKVINAVIRIFFVKGELIMSYIRD